MKDRIKTEPLMEAIRVGRLLRGARVRKGLTQEQLAQVVGVPLAFIEDYEDNKRPVPVEQAELMARVLNTVPEHFLGR